MFKKLSIPTTRKISALFILVFTFSCGTYQYNGYVNDGIYEQYSTPVKQEVAATNESKDGNKYYQSVFNELAENYNQKEDVDEIFTDVENYQSSQNDSLNKNYGSWGENKNSIEINLYTYRDVGFWSRWSYPNWMWNYGYGYGNVWGYGYNNYWSRPFPYYGGFYDPFNPFYGYYNSFYYGYGYPYYFHGYMYPYYYFNNYNYNNYWGNSYSFINGRRGSRSAISSRIPNQNIRFNSITPNMGSSILSKRFDKIEGVKNAARINPSFYNKTYTSNSKYEKPKSEKNSYPNMSKPNSNYNNYKYDDRGSNNSKPSYSRPSYSNPSYSRPSYSSPSRSSSSPSVKSGRSKR